VFKPFIISLLICHVIIFLIFQFGFFCFVNLLQTWLGWLLVFSYFIVIHGCPLVILYVICLAFMSHLCAILVIICTGLFVFCLTGVYVRLAAEGRMRCVGADISFNRYIELCGN